MINIYDAKETNFNNNGIGSLKDTIKSEVTEELNGEYVVEFEYPKGCKYSEKIENDKIIKLDTGENTMQLFRIKNCTENLSTITATLQHITYDLIDNELEDVFPQNLSGDAAIKWILSHAQYQHNFKGSSNIAAKNSARYVRKNIMEAIIGDIDNSFVNIWGGEILRDNYNIQMLAKRGQDSGYKIKYRKNLQGIEFTRDDTEIITRLRPIGYNGIMLPEKYIDSPLIAQYAHPKIGKIEYSDIKLKEKDDDEGYNTLEECYTELRRRANLEFSENNIDKPKVNVKVDFIDLSKTTEYKKYNFLSQVKLGDTLTIEIDKIQLKLRVIRTVYDSLLHRFTKLELGEFKANYITDTEKNISNTIKKETEIMTTDILDKAKNDATEQLVNALGGYVCKTQNELFIMDTDNMNTAKRVWRWNLNGLGYSKSGINGPYGIAITQDGQIVADYITTGQLNASLITTGVLKSANYKSGSTGMSINLENGVIDTAKFKVSANGTITATGGTIGGFTIGSKYLANGTTSLGGASSSVYVGTNGISCGTAFKVTNAGAITASSGTIGGFSLGSTAFTGTLSGKYDYTYFDANIAASMIMEALYTSSSLVDILDIDNNGEVRATDYARIKSIVEGDLENTTNFSGTFQINSKNPRSCLVIKKGNEEVIALGIGGVQSKMVTTENFVCGYVTASSTSSFKGVAINGRTPKISFMEGNNIGTSITSTAVNSANFGKPSLAELKKNIVRIQKDALELIQNSDIYEYNYKTEKNGDKKHYGFVIGEEYNTPVEVLSKDEKAINIDNITAIAWRGIQQIIEKLNIIEQKIKVLEGSE